MAESGHRGLTDNEKLIDEVRNHGEFENRRWMIEIIDRLTDALEATEAAEPRYAVIAIGCTECGGGDSTPGSLTVTNDFEAASEEARTLSDESGAQGDAFVVRLTDGAIVARRGGLFGYDWVTGQEAQQEGAEP